MASTALLAGAGGAAYEFLPQTSRPGDVTAAVRQQWENATHSQTTPGQTVPGQTAPANPAPSGSIAIPAASGGGADTADAAPPADAGLNAGGSAGQPQAFSDTVAGGAPIAGSSSAQTAAPSWAELVAPQSPVLQSPVPPITAPPDPNPGVNGSQAPAVAVESFSQESVNHDLYEAYAPQNRRGFSQYTDALWARAGSLENKSLILDWFDAQIRGGNADPEIPWRFSIIVHKAGDEFLAQGRAEDGAVLNLDSAAMYMLAKLIYQGDAKRCASPVSDSSLNYMGAPYPQMDNFVMSQSEETRQKMIGRVLKLEAARGARLPNPAACLPAAAIASYGQSAPPPPYILDEQWQPQREGLRDALRTKFLNLNLGPAL
ncbi:MAG: hypothetical protein WDO70_01820 [Alphaproteobacteria bacterium]